MENKAEDIVIVSSDSEPPRRKKKPASKEYMQAYYLKHKGAFVCEHCERVYTCKSSLVKHQNRSAKCYIERVKTAFDEIKQTPTDEFNPGLTFQKMEAILHLK